MNKYIYLALAVASALSAVWYAFVIEPSTAGAGYQNTFSYISIGATVAFAGLFLSSLAGRDRRRSSREGVRAGMREPKPH